MEACRSRKARIQRNPIACALLVWVRLKAPKGGEATAYQSHQTVDKVKHRMLSSYLIQQLKCPSVLMVLA